MRVIDLLNKIANSEEVPKHIRIRDVDSYTWQEDISAYWSDTDENSLLSDLDLSSTDLGEEVEIIEEPQEHKIPEKIEEREIEITMAIGEQVCANKINEIIDYLEEENEQTNKQ